MEGTKIMSLTIFFFFAFAAIVPTLIVADDNTTTNVNVDDFWVKRAAQAKLAVLQAYEPSPYNVTDLLNMHVHRALQEVAPVLNTTRRELRGRKYKGPCLATNPIDRCWRCKSNWHRNRKALANCALGFGQKAIGGKYGRYYIVTDSSDSSLSDPKPGTLRHAVTQKEPLWIIFKKSMIIRLKGELICESYKTIDGRGAHIHIAYGAGIMLQGVHNVIIHNVYIHNTKVTPGGMIRSSTDHVGFRTESEGDGITIFGSHHIWIDHVSMRKCADGLIDVVQASTAVTISNGHFTNHNDVMLFGAADVYSDDRVMQVTVAFNHFGKELVQRMPRVRWGFAHVVNNDYTQWQMYAIGGSCKSTIISEGNRFVAPNLSAAKEVTHRENPNVAEWSKWTWRSKGDWFVNKAYFTESGDPNGVRAKRGLDKVVAQSGKFAPLLTHFSGVLHCSPRKPC